MRRYLLVMALFAATYNSVGQASAVDAFIDSFTKKNNFNGTTYILTGGNTFSAASLFTKALKDQHDVIVVGEETGGGAYGNTAWLIPDVTLPITRVRFRLPLFRLVVDKNEQKGRGIIPEVLAIPTVEAIRRNADFKMEKTLQLIKEKNSH